MSGTGSRHDAGPHGGPGPAGACAGTAAAPRALRTPCRPVGPTARQRLRPAAILPASARPAPAAPVAADGSAARSDPSTKDPPPRTSRGVLVGRAGPVRPAAGHTGRFTSRPTAAGRVPVRVKPGQAAEARVRYVVTDCRAAPADTGFPFLDVTLRNTRAIREPGRIPGADHALDLSENLHAACRLSAIRTRAFSAIMPDSDDR